MQRAEEGAGCLSGYWRAGADELHPSGGRRTVQLHRKRDNECQHNTLYRCFTVLIYCGTLNGSMGFTNSEMLPFNNS